MCSYTPIGHFNILLNSCAPADPCCCCCCCRLQGGLVVNATGSYRPALRITGMTSGMALHLDDFEVGTCDGFEAFALCLVLQCSAWQC